MLRHTWTTTMSSNTYRDTVFVRFTRDAITGFGEGAPIVRYNEFPTGGQLALDAILDKIAAGDPWQFNPFLRQSSPASTATRRPRRRWISR